MAYQAIFKRYEIKYMLTTEQKEQLLQIMAQHMVLDQYGRSTIRNIYFDTDNYRLIRHSIEKPAYKEKLRIRSYHRVEPDGEVFVELKKKYDSVVYKRRLSMPQDQALLWMRKEQPGPTCQIGQEIDYFLEYYKSIHPTVFLSYDRTAYYACNDRDFRVTFDHNILSRREDIDLGAGIYGTSLLEDGKVLMELKTTGGIPLWMTHALTDLHIYKTSFSKYGTAYQTMIYPNLQKESLYV